MIRYLFAFILGLGFLCAPLAFAQDAPAGLPILDVIANAIGGAPAIIFTVLGMAVALAMRVFKTERPAGILYLVLGFARRGVVILGQLVNVLTKCVEALEKINPVPQNAEKPAPQLEIKQQ